MLVAYAGLFLNENTEAEEKVRGPNEKNRPQDEAGSV